MSNGPVDVLGLRQKDSRGYRVKEVLCENPLECSTVVLGCEPLTLNRFQAVAVALCGASHGSGDWNCDDQ
ncbi:MAG TPA: hypothetical protein VEK78_06860 [Gemmatimonadales bacterium]|nr:hypothetical protein [Gemmatimonadales bacterium]